MLTDLRSLSVRIKTPTSSVETLQLRLDEAIVNKKANEYMEESDKRPRRTRTRLRITDGVSATPGSDIRSSSRTSSSSGSASSGSSSTRTTNRSPQSRQPQRTESIASEPRLAGAMDLRWKHAQENQKKLTAQARVRRSMAAAFEQDQGEYYIRNYRRESTASNGQVEVLSVRDYVYWPPERR